MGKKHNFVSTRLDKIYSFLHSTDPASSIHALYLVLPSKLRINHACMPIQPQTQNTLKVMLINQEERRIQKVQKVITVHRSHLPGAISDYLPISALTLFLSTCAANSAFSLLFSSSLCLALKRSVNRASRSAFNLYSSS
jgi:hypothetical protein